MVVLRDLDNAGLTRSISDVITAATPIDGGTGPLTELGREFFEFISHQGSQPIP